MIEVGELDHINIETEEIDRSARFYEEILGMKEGARPVFDRPGYWMYVGNKPLVHIIAPAADNKMVTGSHDAAISHFALRIKDFEATKAHLDAAGIDYWINILDDFPIRQFFFDDPDGVVIELIHIADGFERAG